MVERRASLFYSLVKLVKIVNKKERGLLRCFVSSETGFSKNGAIRLSSSCFHGYKSPSVHHFSRSIGDEPIPRPLVPWPAPFRVAIGHFLAVLQIAYEGARKKKRCGHDREGPSRRGRWRGERSWDGGSRHGPRCLFPYAIPRSFGSPLPHGRQYL